MHHAGYDKYMVKGVGYYDKSRYMMFGLVNAGGGLLHWIEFVK